MGGRLGWGTGCGGEGPAAVLLVVRTRPMPASLGEGPRSNPTEMLGAVVRPSVAARCRRTTGSAVQWLKPVVVCCARSRVVKSRLLFSIFCFVNAPGYI
jgi:hypothetical protein